MFLHIRTTVQVVLIYGWPHSARPGRDVKVGYIKYRDPNTKQTNPTTTKQPVCEQSEISRANYFVTIEVSPTK